MVREGETYQHEEITVKIVEVAPIRHFSGRKELMISYQIIDGRYVSPVAHFWMSESADIREKIREIVEYYKKIKSSILGR
ncbi:hypothetical protein DRO30_00860 [Candidatus Bathyarchaeota archaeon]|nr:MAG: hypothetical protein DRO30_00860 [Candidatus Bathyarchaeota archaeon]